MVMATDSHASSPGDSSTGRLSSALVDLDPERRLAAAVLDRAVRDINGSRCTNGSRQERIAPLEALTFIEDAGEMFEFWATLAGREPCCLRRALLQRVPQERLTQVRAARAEAAERERSRWLARRRGWLAR